jgi:hypothetical protein
MTIYSGHWTEDGAVVLVDGRPLDPKLDLANKSPTGFAWGYGGSGPGQLALAILADYLQDDQETQRWYQAFKWRVITGLDRDHWKLTAAQVAEVLDSVRGEVAATGN